MTAKPTRMLRHVLLALCLCAAGARPDFAGDDFRPEALASDYTEKVDLMPDLCQMDGAFRSLPGRGGSWCAPTSLANALIALHQLGFRRLVSGDPESKSVQLALLKQLGAKDYLNTDGGGTQPIGAMNGIARYVRDCGYDVTVEWKGWRNGGAFARGEVVDEPWLRQGVTGASNVLLNIGWYHHDQQADNYRRIAGHYMTLAGYETGDQGTIYLIQDPAPRSGPGKIIHRARLVRIPHGTLTAAWADDGPRDARPHFFVEGIVLKPGADAAILDGAIRFTVR